MAPRILIVGGGIAGLSTAWHLTRDGGCEVVLAEREPLFGTHSSGRNAAILRTVGGDPVTNRIAAASAEFLREPPAGFCDVPLVDPCGLLLVATAASADELRRQVDAARELVRVREVHAHELRTLAPHFAPLEQGGVAFHFPDEGRIDVAALVDAFARGARQGGADLRTDCPIERLVTDGERVMGAQLEDGAVIEADVVVLASGGWASRLGNAAGSRVALRPTRRHLMVTAPDEGVDPRWPVIWQQGDEFYCRPESGGLLLCGCDLTDVDPDACDVDPTVRELISEKSSRNLPASADAGAAHFWSGVRTLTEDGRFAVGYDADIEGLFWVAGLGGHGMVCGAEVGRIAAEGLEQERRVPNAIAGALDPERLRAPDESRPERTQERSQRVG